MGVRKLLNWIWARYHVPICITETETTAKGETEPSKEVLNCDTMMPKSINFPNFII